MIGAKAHLVPALICPRKYASKAAASMLRVAAAKVARWVVEKPNKSLKIRSMRQAGEPNLNTCDSFVALQVARGFETCATQSPGIQKCLSGQKMRCGAIAVMRHVQVLAQILGADYVYVSLKEDAMSGGGKG